MPKRQAQESLVPTPKEGKPTSSKKKSSNGGILANKKKKMPKPVTMKRRAQESLAPTPKEGKPSPSKKRSSTGGIVDIEKKKYKSSGVEIRPSKWKKKIWIGGLNSPEDAHQVADLVFFYTGKPPVHSKAVRKYPSITCMGRVPGSPEELSTQEMFRSYTSAIAKGVKFKPQREDFIAQLKGVCRRPEFAFLPADHGVVSSKQDEVKPVVVSPNGDDGEQVVVSPNGDDGEQVVVSPNGDDGEHVEEEDTPAMEDDENAAMARRVSSNGVRAAVRPGSVSFAAEFNSFSGVDSVQGFLPGFDVQPSDYASILRSEGQSIGSIPLLESTEDFSTSQDEEDDQEWKQWINADDDPSAAGASTR